MTIQVASVVLDVLRGLDMNWIVNIIHPGRRPSVGILRLFLTLPETGWVDTRLRELDENSRAHFFRIQASRKNAVNRRGIWTSRGRLRISAHPGSLESPGISAQNPLWSK
ncbi:unnamed protein product, partial [Mycena citricolor]